MNSILVNSTRIIWIFRAMVNCIDYNESLRNPGNTEEPAYPEYKFRNIMRFIDSTGIISDVEDDLRLVAMIGRRIQSEMTRSVVTN